MAKVVSKQIRIDEIVSMLEQGMETKDILRKITENYGIGKSSVEKYIKEAKVIHSERNKQREEVRLSVTTEVLKNELNEAIISDMELEAILCTIAKGNIEVEEIIRGQAVLRNVLPSEQIGAIDKLFKKRGTYAPTKQDVNLTDKGGADKLFIEK
jgi:hypothetical protein